MDKRARFRPHRLNPLLLGMLAATLAACGQGPNISVPTPLTPTAPPTQAGPRVTVIAIQPAATATSAPAPTPFSPADRPQAMPPAAVSSPASWTSPVDGMVLLFVPAHAFFMGSTQDAAGAQPDEFPQRRVNLDAYWIDETEVTRGMYQACVDDGGCTPVPDLAQTTGQTGTQLPMVMVNWEQARAYCAWAGRRLPTEAEWEKAARGTDGRGYPWGWIGAPETRDQILLNFCDASCSGPNAGTTIDDGFPQAAPVGSYPPGASPYGALDMAGNVWEWVADWYQSGYYASAPTSNPTGPSSGLGRVIRGGSWYEPTWSGIALNHRAANRSWHDPLYGQFDLGFRCAVDSRPSD